MIDSKLEKHWENVHSTKKENEVSWYQIFPQKSIDFIKDQYIIIFIIYFTKHYSWLLFFTNDY